jgi:4-amino-4-deoxy-L-arabinose transferase-like glycosyltransferase
MRPVVLAILALGVLRTLLAALIPPFQDETYYWVWSLNPSTGYFDHPPAIAWVVAAGTALAGDTNVGVRLGAILCGVIASLAVVALARRLGGRDGAVHALMLLVAIPVASVGLLISTPDAPLFLALAVAMLAMDRAVESSPGGREDTTWWLLAGVALGAAFTSKYTAVLFPFGVTLAFLLHPDLRRRFATPGPWLGALTGLVLFAPVVLWNARNEWASFAFQLGHGLGSGGRGSILSREAELLGGQLGLASPVLFVLMALAVWRAARDRGDPRRFVLGVTALTMFGFFVLSAARKPVEANWPAMAYLPGMVLLAAAAGRSRAEAGPRAPAGRDSNGSMEIFRGRLYRWGIGIGLAFTLILHAQALVPLLPISPGDDPIAEAHGWDDLASAIQDEVVRAEQAPACRAGVWVALNRYQDASETAFHRPGRPVHFSLNLNRRPNQYDFWPGFTDLAAPGACLVAAFATSERGEAVADHVAGGFAEAVRGPVVEMARGEGVWTRRQVWRFVDWDGDPGAFTWVD